MPVKLAPQAETLSGSPQPNFVGYSKAPVISKRAPLSTDTGFSLGQSWVDKVGANAYQLVAVAGGSATWAVLGGSTSAIATLTGDSGTATPSAGNIKIAGTANQLTTAASGATVTLSLPAAITAPGSLTTTTSLSATTTITAGTGLTVTTGNATVTNGNLSLSTAGNKIIIATGSNASVGTSGVMSGTPGAVTVATTACSATAKVFFCRNVTGGTPGQVSITAQDGTGFTLTSTGNETSTFNWWIINA